MKPTTALLAVPLVFSSCLVPDYGAQVHVGYMQIEPNGNFALQDSNATNALDSVRNDIDDGFDVSDAGTPFAHGVLNLDNWDIVASAFVYDDTSSSLLTQDFGDIPANTPVNTDLSIYNLKVAVTHEIVDLPVVRVSGGLCLDFFHTDVEARSANRFEELEFTVPAPLLFARAVAGSDMIHGTVEIGWIDADLGDADGSYFDLDAMVTFAPLPMIEFVAGYRNILIDVDGDVEGQDFGTHLKLSGWYIGGGIGF